MTLLKNLIQQNVNFAKWRLPQKENYNFIVEGESNSGTDSTKFIINPFNSHTKDESFYISKDKNDISLKQDIFIPKQTTKEQYLDLVKKTVLSIRNGNQKKVVISRVEIHHRQENCSLAKIFDSLCEKHPTAFIFCYHHRQLGTWIGATPEQLIRNEKNGFSTMALAGTKSLDDKSPWRKKEIEEHQFVINDLVNKVKTLNGKNIKQHVTETISTGIVKHLHTKITFQSNKSIPEISQHFHPTPAVCGTPTKSALEFILKNEEHDRSCYTGYIGPIEDSSANLFVNLRSMQVTDSKFILYLGGGITSSSDPEKEWEETKNKSQTMLSVIQKC